MKLVVIGNSGSGKSTFARRAAAEHGLVYLELDSIVWEMHGSLFDAFAGRKRELV